ncbi:MAG: ABC transporter permease, partial [Rectinemataceae bacterium]
AEEGWDLIIKPRSPFLSIDLAELIRYRDLVGLLVGRDLSTVYKQTILGPVWFVIQPLITTFVFMFIFGKLAGLSTDGVPGQLFYYSGTMIWLYFQTCLTNVSDTFVANSGLFGKVYFPRLAVPVAKVISNLAALCIQFAAFIVIFAWFVIQGKVRIPGLSLMALPFIVLWIAALSAGFGMVISSLTVKYRDLRQLLGFGMQLWMYATPVVYPLSVMSKKYSWIEMVNPMAAPMEAWRVCLFGVGGASGASVVVSIMSTLALLLLGLILFQRNAATFIDVA